MFTRFLVTIAINAGLLSSAFAAPSYFAEAGALSGADFESSTNTLPVSAAAQDIQTFTIGGGEHLGLGTWSGDATAHAGRGFLRTSSHTSIVITDHQASLGSGAKGGGSHASFVIDDVIISGPAGGTVAGTLNLHFEGTIAASANFANALGGSGAYGQIAIGVGLPGVSASGGARLGAGAPPANSLTLTNSGLLTGYGGGLLDLQVESAALPVGTPFSISLDLQSETVASYSVGGTGVAIVPISAEGVSDYTNTFSFATNGPVFTLPEGYTANSADGMIVNNHFIPEPSSIAMAAFALAALIAVTPRGTRNKGSRRYPCHRHTGGRPRPVPIPDVARTPVVAAP